MSDLYSNDSGSKKKFLAPVLVMLLCMVSLSGAAYAYNATVSNVDDGAVVEGTTISLTYLNQQTPTDVNFAIVDLGIMYGTHTTNGYAIDYEAGIGFKAFAPAQAPSQTQAYPANALNTFAPGYYVKTQYAADGAAPTDAGFHVVATGEAVDTASELAALAVAQENQGVVKFGKDYTLTVTNATQSDVAVKFKAVYTTAIDLLAGVSDVRIAITNGDDIDISYSIKAALAEQTIDTILADESSETYTVSLYLIVSDYWSDVVPTVTEAESLFAMVFGTDL